MITASENSEGAIRVEDVHLFMLSDAPSSAQTHSEEHEAASKGINISSESSKVGVARLPTL